MHWHVHFYFLCPVDSACLHMPLPIWSRSTSHAIISMKLFFKKLANLASFSLVFLAGISQTSCSRMMVKKNKKYIYKWPRTWHSTYLIITKRSGRSSGKPSESNCVIYITPTFGHVKLMGQFHSNSISATWQCSHFLKPAWMTHGRKRQTHHVYRTRVQ